MIDRGRIVEIADRTRCGESGAALSLARALPDGGAGLSRNDSSLEVAADVVIACHWETWQFR